MKAPGALRLLGEALWQSVRRPAQAVAPSEVRRILVLGYGAVGDIIFFLPALQGLRQGFPGARIVFLANRYMTTEELLPASGLADDIWLHDWEGPQALAERAGINERIARAGFDLAVLTLSSPAHYFRRGLEAIPLRAGHLRASDPLPLWARLKKMLVIGEFSRRALLNRKAWIAAGTEHAVPRNLRLLDALGLPRPPQGRPDLRLPQGCRDFASRPSRTWTPARSASRFSWARRTTSIARCGLRSGSPSSAGGSPRRSPRRSSW